MLDWGDKVTAEAIGVTLLASCTSGLLGIFIANWHNKKQQETQIKITLLNNVLGYRYQIVNGYKGSDKELFTSLNQIFVIYNNSKQVMSSLTKLHEELAIHGRNETNLLSLVKDMCNDVGIGYNCVNDDFFLRPFVNGIDRNSSR